MSPRAAKNWKVPTRMWLAATRVNTAPGRAVSRQTGLAGGDCGEGAGRGDAEGGHGLADEVLAQHGAERGPAVTAAGEGRGAGAFELDVAAAPVLADDLAEQNGAAVAELRGEAAELVAGIGECDRVGAGRR